jgi:methionine-rich copper-binding protein CopC
MSRKYPVFLTVLILMSAVAIAPAASAADLSISLDKPGYGPGETVTVTGNANAGTDVTVQLFNPNAAMVDIQYATASGDGTYSFTFKIPSTIPTGNWLSGTYTVRAYSGMFVNATFEVSASTAADTTDPVISSRSPADGATVTNASPMITVIYSDDVAINASSVVLKIDGADVTSGATITSSQTSYVPASLSNGNHTVYFEVKDTSGNSGSATWTFTVSVWTTGKTSPDAGFNAGADLNGDGLVNYIDLAMLGFRYGSGE